MFLDVLPHLGEVPGRHVVGSHVRHSLRLDLAGHDAGVQVVLDVEKILGKAPKLGFVLGKVGRRVEGPQLLLDVQPELQEGFLRFVAPGRPQDNKRKT